MSLRLSQFLRGYQNLLDILRHMNNEKAVQQDLLIHNDQSFNPSQVHDCLSKRGENEEYIEYESYVNESKIQGYSMQEQSQYKESYDYDSIIEFYCHLIKVASWNPEEVVKALLDQGERDKDRIEEFRKLHFKNHILLVKFLACQAHKKRFKYVAEHYFNKKSVKIDNSLGTQYQFQLKVEKGDAIVKKGTHPAEQAKALWEKGQKEVIKWMQDIIEGIIELQEAGIFHADLAIRNTIEVKDIYKIIDFDISFKVEEGQSAQGKCAFEHTKALLLFMLDSLSEDNSLINNYLFRDIVKDHSPLEQILQIKNAQQIDNKVQKLTQLMHQYSILYHKVQFEAIITKILKAPQCTLNNEIIQSILNKVAKIDSQNIDKNISDYRQIIEFLKTINLQLSNSNQESFQNDSQIDIEVDSQQQTRADFEGDNFDGKLEEIRKQWPDGRIYLGDIEDDKMQGYGRMWFPDGSFYVGDFYDDKMQGYGRMWSSDERFYVGAFSDDKMEGRGRMRWPDGRVYIGRFIDNTMQEYGQMYYPDDIMCQEMDLRETA